MLTLAIRVVEVVLAEVALAAAIVVGLAVLRIVLRLSALIAAEEILLAVALSQKPGLVEPEL